MERTQESYRYDFNKIRLERARQGKSIAQLAEEANLSPKTLIRIEHNKVIPRPQTVGKIAAALGKDIEDFIINAGL
ncbi:helix-turn-helix domain protein [Caldicellulosiruptor owensensis OL]|uniref:Helix-turn-helix domain protein n=1 Tax=Caldicellulosiruptor owensensis (strain ATCC 700167 / DSM 13100 / OL) TaxID=632518 RepID=E4Q658_CALOW|nr:helix-turn-helix transcriptional regulator [Caldicellulosiruptor owensensis]ADQ05543.1 helix-turn-helix domain protein [Caldicellulosiruptor owensensis OL]